MKMVSLESLTDKHIGKRGTKSRTKFEQELSLEILAHTIRTARLEKELSQAELGKIVGVQKSQISKIENSLTDARLSTLLKVFEALQLKVYFSAV